MSSLDAALSTLIAGLVGVVVLGWLCCQLVAEVRYRRLFDRYPRASGRCPLELEGPRPLVIDVEPLRVEGAR